MINCMAYDPALWHSIRMWTNTDVFVLFDKYCIIMKKNKKQSIQFCISIFKCTIYLTFIEFKIIVPYSSITRKLNYFLFWIAMYSNRNKKPERKTHIEDWGGKYGFENWACYAETSKIHKQRRLRWKCAFANKPW